MGGMSALIEAGPLDRFDACFNPCALPGPFAPDQETDGARFGTRGGRMIPRDYGDPHTEYGYIRGSCAVIDVGIPARFRIHGRDAMAVLQRLFAGDVDTPVGRGTYGCFCNEGGGVIDDGIVWRLGPRCWRATLTTSGRERMRTYLAEACAKPGLRAWVADETERLVTIAIQGPRASEVLVALGFRAASSLRFLEATRDTAAGVGAWIARAGFTGELGYEIFVGPGSAQRAWRAAVVAARVADGGPCGLDAMVLSGMESGLRVAGVDHHQNASPIESGIGFTVAFGKHAVFVGREALQRERESGVARRVVGFSFDPAGGVPQAGDQVVYDAAAGSVLWAARSPATGQGIGRCRLEGHPGGIVMIATRHGAVAAELHSLNKGRRRRFSAREDA